MPPYPALGLPRTAEPLPAGPAGRLHQPAFRLAVRELGGLGLATTDLVNARALLLASRKTMELIQTCPEDRPVAVQIYGSVPEEMRDAAQWLEDYGVSSVDINMGCPVHKVVRGGGGSAMMCDAGQDGRPGAHRRRGGAHPGHRQDAPRLGRRQLERPVLRARVRAGRRRRRHHPRPDARPGLRRHASTCDGIRAVVEAVERIPVIGNGDVRTLADADEMLRADGLRRHRHRPRGPAQPVDLRAAVPPGGNRRPGAGRQLRASASTSWTGTSTCWSSSAASASAA